MFFVVELGWGLGKGTEFGIRFLTMWMDDWIPAVLGRELRFCNANGEEDSGSWGLGFWVIEHVFVGARVRYAALVDLVAMRGLSRS